MRHAARSQPVPNLRSLAYRQIERAAGWRQRTVEEENMDRLDTLLGNVQVSKLATAAAIGVLLAQGIIHGSEAPAQYAEVPYLGVLFVLTLAGALVAAIGMARGMTWGWLL